MEPRNTFTINPFLFRFFLANGYSDFKKIGGSTQPGNQDFSLRIFIPSNSRLTKHITIIDFQYNIYIFFLESLFDPDNSYFVKELKKFMKTDGILSIANNFNTEICSNLCLVLLILI